MMFAKRMNAKPAGTAKKSPVKAAAKSAPRAARRKLKTFQHTKSQLNKQLKNLPSKKSPAVYHAQSRDKPEQRKRVQ